MTVYISFDPGEETGWAEFRDDTFRFESLGGHLQHSRIWSLLSRQNPDVVIYEQFEVLNGATSIEPFALEIIGVIKFWAQWHNRPCHESALANKALWNDKKLRTLGGTYPMPTNRHQKDAMRHLLYHIDPLMNHSFLRIAVPPPGMERRSAGS
jgi:hypothetical protein